MLMDAHSKETDPTRFKHRLLVGMASVILAVTTLLIYFPGLSGPYVLDDDENITKNAAVAIEEISAANLWRAMQSNDSGFFKRPLPTLSFALNHYFAGGFGNTFPFKLTNLIIHITNGILLLFLALKILRYSKPGRILTPTEQLYVAVLAAALWTVHPIQLTNILYVVQRMNSLSALFVILGLTVFLEGRQRLAGSAPKGLTLMGAGVFFGTLLGMGCKENAILLPLFALTIEYCFFRHEDLGARQRFLLRSFYLVIVAALLLVFLGYLYVNPEFVTGGYKVRHFSMMERLLTETRVLWYYLHLITLPSTYHLGLFHDDIMISKGLFTPPVTLLATCGLIAFVLIAFVKRISIISFAILWFLAGHLLESSVFALELAYEHRNYLPTFGIFFAVSYAYMRASRHWNTRLRFIAAIAVIFALGFATWSRANDWRDIYSIAETNVTNHPNSPRANEFAAHVNALRKRDLLAAIRYSVQTLNVAPDEVGFHIDLHLYMTMLASQIEKNMRAAGMEDKRGARIRIDGLPAGVTATINDGEINLVYPLSTNDTIEKLLKTEPITVHTLGSLIGLSRCILDKPSVCQRLSGRAIKWYTLAADNADAVKADNALILNNTAELYANSSNYDSALTYINRATQAFPDVLFYRLNKIKYLIKLGRLDEARSLLSTIDAIRPENDIRLIDNRAIINAVQDMYAEAIKADSGHR